MTAHQRWVYWTTVGLVAALTVAAAAVPWWSVTWDDFVAPVRGFIALLAPWLFYYMLMVFLVVLNLDRAEGMPSRGDVEWLLSRKRRAGFLPTGRFGQRSTARPGRLGPANRVGAAARAETELEHLLGLKRRATAGRHEARA